MNLARYYRFVLVLALILGLVLLGRELMVLDDAANAPGGAAGVADVDDELAPVPTATPTIAPSDPRSAPAANVSSPAGIFRGRIIDALTREPVREFALEIHGDRSATEAAQAPGAREFQTKDGRFVWSDIPAGTWAVTATARGYQRFELNELQISSGAATEMVLPLQRGYALRGLVYDEVSGAGIASATISFRESHVDRFEGNFRARARTTTNEDGSFVLDGVPAGRIILSVSAPEYAGREIDVIGVQKAPLQIALSAGGSIAGYLAAADGTPIAGFVALFNIDENHGSGRKTSDAGEFSFKHLAPGLYRLGGRDAAGQHVEREITLAKNERMEGIVLAVRAGRSIRGVITGLTAAELQHVNVSVSRDGALDSGLASVDVDAGGEYVLEGVEPGPVTVMATMNQRVVSKRVEMPPDADITVNLEYPRGVRLTGHVTRTGKPLGGVWLEPLSVEKQDSFVYGASTSPQGEYVIENLPKGEYFVVIGSYRSRIVQVAGDTVFDIDVPPAHVSGRTLEQGGKVPIVGVDLALWSVQPDSQRLRFRARSDHFGQFTFTGLEPGEYVLSAYKPGYEMYRERISYGSPISGMTLQLRPGTGVEIRVQEAGSGRPIRNVRASEMIGDRQGTSFTLRLDEHGRGHLPSALAGSALTFYASGYAPAMIRDWRGQGLDLQLERQKAQ